MCFVSYSYLILLISGQMFEVTVVLKTFWELNETTLYLAVNIIPIKKVSQQWQRDLFRIRDEHFRPSASSYLYS